jgi:hypothetical protein
MAFLLPLRSPEPKSKDLLPTKPEDTDGAMEW